MIINSPIISGSLTTSGSMYVNSPNTTMGQFVGNQNGYVEFSIRNTSTGVSASGDIAVYADDGTPTAYYIDMGINNSNAAAYAYDGAVLGKAHDAYVFNTGGNLIVGNANNETISQSLYLFANPSGISDLTITGSNVGIGRNFLLPKYTLDVSGSVNVNNNLTVSGSLTIATGTNNLTASWANNAITASYAVNATTASYAVNATTASYAVNATTASYAVNATTAATASFANTFTVANTLTAQTLVVQTITSSVDFVTGSARFGSTTANTFQVTGSMTVSGSTHSILGNVGIGTTNPTIKFNVVDNSTNEAASFDNSGTFGSWIHIYGSATGGKKWRLHSSAGTDANTGSLVIRNATDGINAIVINQSGSVGIGTTSPSALLHLSSTIPLLKFTNTSAGAGAGSIQFYSGSTQIWNLGTDTSNNLYLYNNNTATYNIGVNVSNGYIGINKTTPNATLDINGNTIVSGSLTIANNTMVMSGSAPYSYYVSSNAARTYLAGVDSNGYIIYDNTAGAYRMILSPSGNFGIGAATPSDIIDVRKNQNATTNFYFRNTDTTDANSRAYLNVIAGNTTLSLLALHGGDTYIAGTSGRNMYFQQNPGGTVNMFISGSGNVGIGNTSPRSPLSFANTTGDKIDFYNDGTNRYTAQINGGELRFYTAGTDVISLYAGGTMGLVNKAGNIGIGTTTPNYKLDVAGSINSTFTKNNGQYEFVRTVYSGASNTTGWQIIRQFHDSVNWGNGGILVEIICYSYSYSELDHAFYFARYGYSGNSAGVDTRLSPITSRISAPYWAAAVSVDGRYYYRDLVMDITAYHGYAIKMTTILDPYPNSVGSSVANQVYLFGY